MPELTDLERVRAEKIERLRAAGMPAYALSAERTHTAAQVIAEFEAAVDDRLEASVVGRIKSARHMGKTSFVHIEDGSGRLQLYFRVNEVGEERLDLLEQAFDLGDFIQAQGFLFRTKTGEVTLHVEHFRMLAKAITPLPTPKVEVIDGQQVVHDAFADPEARYRQRYVDLAVNPDVRQIFRTRARILRAAQTFLDERGFLEVETPILQPIYGGAASTPFTTHHEQLHQDLYLRISFELYLKRLLVGNLERVYEIGRDFRNEGVSFKHNPEFTQLEFYMAYADYHQMMELTELLVAYIAEQVTGSTTINFGEHRIDLTPPWTRMTLSDAIRQHAEIDLDAHPTADGLRGAM
ncbi:MAG TPA: amino acid--tRNA ligase-related protein, partial [Anaerolineales bacterium]